MSQNLAPEATGTAAPSAASVDYATSDVTATNGLDYTGGTNTLSFAPGEMTRRISIPILNDGKNATFS